MSGYPDPNYGPLPDFPSNIGDSCATPKPRWFYDGATFCNDIDVGNLTTTLQLVVGDLTTTSRLIVDGIEFVPTCFRGFRILAEVGSFPLDIDLCE